MTDLSHRPFTTAPVHAARETRGLWRLLPYVCVVVAGMTGLFVGRALGGDTGDFESKLLLLLRFMAIIKFVGVLAAAAVTHWRLTRPIQGGLATAYLVALSIMATAPGLIWSLGGIALGALAFHVGLLAFLVFAWRDDGVGVHLPGPRSKG